MNGFPLRASQGAAVFALLSIGLYSVAAPTAARADRTNPALQMGLGNPDKATAQASNTAHYLIRRPQYALSYNDGLRFPNWVAWHLSHSDIGGVDRGQFQPDPLLPANFTRVTTSDYNRSGYDRGHNCPSKDRTATRADNDSVFWMTNITPQAHGMNAGPWEELESYCRDLTGENKELFIICGHGFSSKKHPTIGRAQIAVPDFAWKIVVVVPPGNGPAVRRITATTRVIAVRMPNISTISRKDWREFRTSVADIEQATGFTFFDALSPSVAQALKNRVDFDQSAPSKRRSSTRPKATPQPTPTPKPRGFSLPFKLPKIFTGEKSPAPATTPAPTSGMVWVNTRSKAYWRPGTRYYGKTKQGKYMTETDAKKAGYHPAEDQ